MVHLSKVHGPTNPRRTKSPKVPVTISSEQDNPGEIYKRHELGLYSESWPDVDY